MSFTNNDRFGYKHGNNKRPYHFIVHCTIFIQEFHSYLPIQQSFKGYKIGIFIEISPFHGKIHVFLMFFAQNIWLKTLILRYLHKHHSFRVKKIN